MYINRAIFIFVYYDHTFVWGHSLVSFLYSCRISIYFGNATQVKCFDMALPCISLTSPQTGHRHIYIYIYIYISLQSMPVPIWYLSLSLSIYIYIYIYIITQYASSVLVSLSLSVYIYIYIYIINIRRPPPFGVLEYPCVCHI